jgi:hypothetical protein
MANDHNSINWFNRDDNTDLVLRAGIAHLWFITIHPFDDGNGRIARALSDMLLARSEQSNQRFYSMSAQIQQERNGYYDMLEGAQRRTLDITEPLRWFLGCMDRAFDNVESMLTDVFRKARFWNAPRSDIDLMIRGLPGEVSYWRLLVEMERCTMPFEISVVLEEDAASSLREKVLAGGREL